MYRLFLTKRKGKQYATKPCNEKKRLHSITNQITQTKELTIMAKVKFGMIWSVYGKQTVDLPDNINPDDLDAVKDYLETIWADIPLPEGEYIDNSDELDEDGEIEIIKDNEV